MVADTMNSFCRNGPDFLRDLGKGSASEDPVDRMLRCSSARKCYHVSHPIFAWRGSNRMLNLFAHLRFHVFVFWQGGGSWDCVCAAQHCEPSAVSRRQRPGCHTGT